MKIRAIVNITLGNLFTRKQTKQSIEHVDSLKILIAAHMQSRVIYEVFNDKHIYLIDGWYIWRAYIWISCSAWRSTRANDDGCTISTMRSTTLGKFGNEGSIKYRIVVNIWGAAIPGQCNKIYTVKKRFASFPSPAGMSLPNSPWAGIMTSQLNYSCPEGEFG